MHKLIGTATDTVDVEVPLEKGSTRPETFLYSVRRAMLTQEAHTRNTVVYNGKRYLLSTEKQSDRHAGVQMQARGILHNPDITWRLNGTITEVESKQATTFETWYERGHVSGLPVRIEFYPKSFLKLVFEQQSADSGPKFSYLLTPKPTPVQTSG